jgi:transposase
MARKGIKCGLQLSEKQYLRIAKLLPVQRGNVKIDNRDMLNALIYRSKNGCSWRALPKDFGNWHVIYMRFSRWAANGVPERIYRALAAEGLCGTGQYRHKSASGCLWVS